MLANVFRTVGIFGTGWWLLACSAADVEPVGDSTGDTVSTSECGSGELPGEEGNCHEAGLPPDMPCPPGEVLVAGGDCEGAGVPRGVRAGLPADMPCSPGQVEAEQGACRPAGIPPGECATGFFPDDEGGCAPVLPKGSCPLGQMAVPGEAACREVAPCGKGTWGEIPTEADTEFVDVAYAGTDSDGTPQKPWKKIQEAVDNAAPGALVAIAGGVYPEDVHVEGKPVRLWGRCPSGTPRVEVVGVAGGVPRIITILGQAASWTEVNALAISGSGAGISVSGATGVRIERTWIHDTTSAGVELDDGAGVTEAALIDVLIESTGWMGLDILGSSVTVEGTVLRAAQPNIEGPGSGGVRARRNKMTGRRSSATLRRSLVEESTEVGVLIAGSDSEILDTVVRRTRLNEDGIGGHGVHVRDDPHVKDRSHVSIRGSYLGANSSIGVAVFSSDVEVSGSVVRDTRPTPQGEAGWGIAAFDVPEPAFVEVRRSLLVGNRDAGMLVGGSKAVVEATVVRSTRANVAGQRGCGLYIDRGFDSWRRASLHIEGAVIEDNEGFGLMVRASDTEIRSTRIHATLLDDDGAAGGGVLVLGDGEQRAAVSVRESLLEDNRGFGVVAFGSEVGIEQTVVRGTAPSPDGASGNGIYVMDSPAAGGRSGLSLRRSLVEDNHEIGILVGGADAMIEESVVRTTRTRPDGTFGQGIEVGPGIAAGQRTRVDIRRSTFEDNAQVGVYVSGADAALFGVLVGKQRLEAAAPPQRGVYITHDAETGQRSQVSLAASRLMHCWGAGITAISSDVTIEATEVRLTRPGPGGVGGRGVQAIGEVPGAGPADLSLRSSLIDDARDFGVLVTDSSAVIERSWIRRTQPNGLGQFGHGVGVYAFDGPASASLTGAKITENVRAGVVFNTGVSISSSVIQCNGFDLEGEVIIEGDQYSVDGGANICGCEAVSEECAIVSGGGALVPDDARPPLRGVGAAGPPQ